VVLIYKEEMIHTFAQIVSPNTNVSTVELLPRRQAVTTTVQPVGSKDCCRIKDTSDVFGTFGCESLSTWDTGDQAAWELRTTGR
jgi:hypothetical protein